MRFFLIFITLAGLLSMNLYGQKKVSISGGIKDTKDNPISQALIAIEGKTVGTYSDDNGTYTLELLPANIISLYFLLVTQL